MKKKLLITGLIFTLTAGIVIFWVARGTGNKAPTLPLPQGGLFQTAPRQISFQDIVPGTTTRDQVIAKLGEPVRIDEDAGKTTLIYASGIGSRAIAVNIDAEGKTERVIEPLVETTALGPLIQNLPPPTLTLYGPHFQAGYELRVYLTRGVALLANPTLNRVRERWFFPPTTESLFITYFSQGYSRTPPPADQQ